jgi:hypothetical protein
MAAHETTVPAAISVPASQKPNMMDKNFALAEFKSRRWRAELTEDQIVEDTADPTFWRHQADKIMGHDVLNAKGRGDILEVFKPDTSEYVELLVTEIGKGFVKTRLISHSKPDDVAVPDASPLTTKWNVGKRAHEVVRKSDNAVMAGGFQSKGSALEWIERHVKAMAA